MRVGALVSTASRGLPTGDNSAGAPSSPPWLVFVVTAFISALTVVAASDIHVRAIQVIRAEPLVRTDTGSPMRATELALAGPQLDHVRQR